MKRIIFYSNFLWSNQKTLLKKLVHCYAFLSIGYKLFEEADEYIGKGQKTVLAERVCSGVWNEEWRSRMQRLLWGMEWNSQRKSFGKIVALSARKNVERKNGSLWKENSKEK